LKGEVAVRDEEILDQICRTAREGPVGSFVGAPATVVVSLAVLLGASDDLLSRGTCIALNSP
jgi:hypothetical protein